MLTDLQRAAMADRPQEQAAGDLREPDRAHLSATGSSGAAGAAAKTMVDGIPAPRRSSLRLRQAAATLMLAFAAGITFWSARTTNDVVVALLLLLGCGAVSVLSLFSRSNRR